MPLPPILKGKGGRGLRRKRPHCRKELQPASIRPAIGMAGAGGAGRQTEAAAALYTIDTAASCPICHALFDTPLLLKSCGHSCEFGEPGSTAPAWFACTATADEKPAVESVPVASQLMQSAVRASAKTWLSRSVLGRPAAPRAGEHVYS